MTRRKFAPLLTCVALAGSAAASEAAVSRMLRDVSRAIQARNAALFLSHFDKKRFRAYPHLESNVVVLTEQKDIASSIRIVDMSAVDEEFTCRVDWLLQISPLDRPGPVDTRRAVLTLRLAPAGKKWRIVEMAPVDFFRPD